MSERRGTKALELWCRRMTEGYPGVKIDNMTTSWRDGLAFCAMIHHFRPDLIEFDKLNKADVYYNNELAFRTAERHLGIPALLDADDMASYEVPDRLSILTYLSQFYQVFASQDSPNRLNNKRTSTVAEKSSITKPTGPPQKMAHIVGVPKREPCQKCSLPVFLAERLTIGKYVYHRTCLRCARCNSQLTPGSFYETEVDGEYCCETCPDEEKLKINDNVVVSDNTAATMSTENIPVDTGGGGGGNESFARKSIAERLAFFEKDGNKVLQKSLSDEEKSQSLKKLSETQLNAIYKPNTALSNFMTTHLSDDAAVDSPSHKTTTSSSSRRSSAISITSSSTSSEDLSDEDISEDPPELPKSLPPSSLEVDNSGTPSIPPPSVISLESGILENNMMNTADKISSEGANNQSKSPIVDERMNITKVDDDNTKKDDEKGSLMMSNANEDAPTVAIKNDLTLSVNVTKDSSEDDEQMRNNNIIPIEETITTTTTTTGTTFHRNKESDSIISVGATISANTISIEDTVDSNSDSQENQQQQKQQSIVRETINRSSMVRARLHQFENIANKSQDSSISSFNNRNRLSNKNHRSIIDDDDDNESQKSLETEVPENISKNEHDGEIHHNDNVDDKKSNENNNSNNDRIINKEEINASYSMDEKKIVKEGEKENSEIQKDSKSKEKYSEFKENDSESTENHSESKEKDSDSMENHSESLENINKEKEVQEENSSEQKITISPIILKEIISDDLSKDNEKPISKNYELAGKSPSRDNDGGKSPKHSIEMEKYPEELNPFKSDDDNENQDEEENNSKKTIPILNINEKRKSLNPFDSSSDEEGNENEAEMKSGKSTKRVSTNPFGSESEDEDSSLANITSNSSGQSKRTPVPTPRNYKTSSQNPTPEPTPRATRQTHELGSLLLNSSDYYGSTSSLSTSGSAVKSGIDRESDIRGSGRSLASSSGGSGGGSGGVIKPRRKKAPAPPPPGCVNSKVSKELLFSSPTDSESKKSSPGSSTATTPTPQRKKRPAPAPPPLLSTKIEKMNLSPSHLVVAPKVIGDDKIVELLSETPKDDITTKLDKLCDEEKALLEKGSIKNVNVNESPIKNTTTTTTTLDENETIIDSTKRRLIALDASLIEDANTSHEIKQPKECENVVYRRTIVPAIMDDSGSSPGKSNEMMVNESHDRQLEKLKDNKEAKNRNRQSQISIQQSSEENDPLYNKSIHGKWKRRKGPAPGLPIPPKKVLQMLPLQEIRHELEIIEVQQQGLEKQGVMLEKMIRERCEGPTGVEKSTTSTTTTTTDGSTTSTSTSNPPNSKEVEDLILQLFELVNEKNELFRRQAELMYLRRQHRLEQEQADLEYEIRVLMAQPERNKTDSDKAREEALIARLVEVVQLRNEVIECLEMDRLREAEEDLSIKQRLELHSAQRDEELCKQTPTKLSKKEKKKQKELKKLGKSKKLDVDKDADETELSEKLKLKKKKKKFLF